MVEPAYSPKYFKAQELVPKELYELCGRGALNVFDPAILKNLDRFRQFCGFPLFGNDWHKGGKFNYRGFRPVGLKPPESAISSTHKRADTFDLVCRNRRELNMLVKRIKEYGKFFGIKRVESFDVTVPRGYVHIVLTAELVDEIYYFNP